MADFHTDVYNNIVATGTVLVFTKLVSHRSRKNRSTGMVVFSLHVAVVILASVSIAIAIAITGAGGAAGADNQLGLTVAWLMLAFSGLVLIGDVVYDAWPGRRRRLSRPNQSSSGPSNRAARRSVRD